MENVSKTIISQYANSPTLLTIIESANQSIDPSIDVDAFYNLIWNVDTARGYGLDVWGRIVGIDRVLKIPDEPENFGFVEGQDYFPFNEAPFAGGDSVTSNYRLEDEAYRALILIKAAANISSVSYQVLNQLLQKLFAGRGRAYVSSAGLMKMRYTFEFYLTPAEKVILASGVLPSPTGVGVEIVEIPQMSTFGFFEAGTLDASPFNVGTFF